jgi:hypothetical protein
VSVEMSDRVKAGRGRWRLFVLLGIASRKKSPSSLICAKISATAKSGLRASL